MVPEQRKLLEMLREIDTICRKHGIEYYLAGGTCIGALRNKGFLPWDDDMDLYMTRKNWEKFMEVSKHDFPPDRVLLCPELVDTYTNMFGRYCDTSCTSLHKHNMYAKRNEDDPCGAIVDILPLYPVPDPSKAFMEQYAQKLALYSQLIMPTGSYVHRLFVKPSTYLKYVWRCHWNRKKVLGELYDELFGYDEDACDYYAMRWGGTPLLFPKEWFQTPTETPFEDMTAMMPTMNNAYLTMHYGDSWVMVPSLKEREGHVAISRTDVPYADFRKEYETIVRHSRRLYMKCFFTILHFCRLVIAKKKNLRETKALMQSGKSVLASMDCQSEAALERLYGLLDERNLLAITEILKPYLNRQLSAKYIGREDFFHILRFNHPVFIPVTEAFLEFVVLFCMHSERIHWALRLMEIKERDGTLSDKLCAWREDIFLFRDAVNDYDMKRYEDCYQKVQELAQRQDRWLSLIKLQIRLFLYAGVGDQAQTGELLGRAQKIFPQDGEFWHYQLLFDRRQGLEPDLEALLEKNSAILSATRNGMALLEIKEEMDGRFEEFYAQARDYLQAENYERFFEWLEKGKPFYKEELREPLTLLETEARFFAPLGDEVPDYEYAAQKIAKQANLLNSVRKRLTASENRQGEWEQLYRKLLSHSGYGEESIDRLVQVITAPDYEALLAMGPLFPKEAASADMCVAYGAYLYALGKSAEAEKQYRRAFFHSQDSSMIHYQMQKLLKIKVMKVM